MYTFQSQNQSYCPCWNCLELTHLPCWRGHCFPLQFSKNMFKIYKVVDEAILQRCLVSKILSISCYVIPLTLRCFLIIDPKDSLQQASLYFASGSILNSVLDRSLAPVPGCPLGLSLIWSPGFTEWEARVSCHMKVGGRAVASWGLSAPLPQGCRGWALSRFCGRGTRPAHREAKKQARRKERERWAVASGIGWEAGGWGAGCEPGWHMDLENERSG